MRTFRTSADDPPANLQYVVAYDSALQDDWSVTTWEDVDHHIAVDTDAAAPGRDGSA